MSHKLFKSFISSPCVPNLNGILASLYHHHSLLLIKCCMAFQSFYSQIQLTTDSCLDSGEPTSSFTSSGRTHRGRDLCCVTQYEVFWHHLSPLCWCTQWDKWHISVWKHDREFFEHRLGVSCIFKSGVASLCWIGQFAYVLIFAEHS